MAGARGGERGRRGTAGRPLAERLRTAKGRTPSSARWLQRQLADPYVARARAEGYRSRAAYKLIEIDDRFHLLGPGKRVVDLGAAPGGWTQVAVERVRGGAPGGGRVAAVDILEMEPVEGAAVLRHDVLAEDTAERLRALLDGPADAVLSDMAPPATGHGLTDRLRALALAEAAVALAHAVLAPGGALVVKVLRGGGERDLVAALRQEFATVKLVKPPASRGESGEIYLVAANFRGRAGAPAA